MILAILVRPDMGNFSPDAALNYGAAVLCILLQG